MKKSLWLVALVICAFVADAQVRTPQPSPAGSVTSTVGAKGRKIFSTDPATVVPFGKIWRTGANSGTKITFSEDVKVEGIAVPKGEYLILTWPGEKEWTVALNKDVKLGGQTDKYDAAQDAAKFKVKPTKLAEKVETLTFSIGDLSDDNKSAKVQLAWENTSVKFSVATEFDALVMKSIEETLKSETAEPYSYFQAAVYYLESGRDLNQALVWVDKAAAGMNSPFWVLHQKAKIQKALGDKAGALTTANASLEGAKQASNRDYQMMNETLIKSLK
jgi:hypothetical protein